MEKIRAQLQQDQSFKDRVPRGDVLDHWIDKKVAERIAQGPHKDHSGDGDHPVEGDGVCTESALRCELDTYIQLGMEALKRGKMNKDAKELQEKIGEELLNEAMGGKRKRSIDMKAKCVVAGSNLANVFIELDDDVLVGEEEEDVKTDDLDEEDFKLGPGEAAVMDGDNAQHRRRSCEHIVPVTKYEDRGRFLLVHA